MIPVVLRGSFCFVMKYAGVEFLKSVPEATYDAIILDAFQEMGISLSHFLCPVHLLRLKLYTSILTDIKVVFRA